MSGTERSKFCSQCGHHVRNLSLMSAVERAEILRRLKTERVCGSYLMRLSVEMVTPAAPLTRSEWSRVRQFGAAALSAGALALATGCVAPAPANTPTVTEAPMQRPATTVSASTTEKNPVALELNKDEEEVVLLTGFFIAPDEVQEDKRYLGTVLKR